MATHKFVAHNSPTSGTPNERLVRSGFRSSLVLENVGRGASAVEVHQGFMRSFGHRDNVLNPDVTHVGVGVIAGDESAAPELYATELFILIPSRIEPAAASARLLQQFNAARQTRSNSPLVTNPQMTQAAVEAAQSFLADPQLSRLATVDRATQQARKAGVALKRVTGLLTVIYTLDNFPIPAEVVSKEVRDIGVGVAQGYRSDLGEAAIVVVVLVGS